MTDPDNDPFIMICSLNTALTFSKWIDSDTLSFDPQASDAGKHQIQFIL